MAYVVDTSERDETDLGNLAPSFGASMRASLQSTFRENASTLIYEAGRLRQANAIPKERLTVEEAQGRAAAAGVKLAIPEDSYTPEALDILIQRQKDNAALALVHERTPWSWLGSPVRGGAQLLTGLVDPLNVASAFVPVVREHRAAAMLERAGASFLARTAVRARIGATEGIAGAAMLEPLVAGLHTQLQDDYGMADSLVNLAFGGLLGGGLHATVGAVGDIRLPRLRGDEVVDVQLPALVSREIVPGSAADAVRSTAPEVREAALRGAVADMAQGRAPEVDVVLRQDERAAVAAAVAEIEPVRETVIAEVLSDVPAGERTVAVDGGLPNGDAPADSTVALANKPPADTAPRELPELSLHDLRAANAGATRLAEVMDAAAGRAGVDPAPLYASEAARLRATAQSVPPQVAARYVAMADMLDARASMLPPPQPRDRSAAGAIAQRQRAPRASAVADQPASAAADARLKAAPKDDGVEAAQDELDAATARLDDLRENLEASGMTKEQAAKLVDGLKPFDDAIAEAKKTGDAVRALATCGTMT